MFKSTKMAAPPPRVKVKNAIVSLLLVAALVITGALAFLTAKDSAENKFTVGNVDISLTEPKWDAANPDGTLENIVAGQVITKDPTITNTGVNDAYVYMMVQVPKADNIAIDGEVVSDHQLFSFTPNAGWTCIAEKTDDNDANNYYLYAFDTALAPKGVANLFDKVTFANTTSDFEASSLKIEIKAYAIQSDFYNGEATNAESAWNLYVNQSGWEFPSVDAPVVVPEGMSALNFVDEDGDVVHTEIAEVGTPIEMYFEPSLAKDGYTFDWVDETTGDVAYSGMSMPEEDTNLIPSYSAIDNSIEMAKGLGYNIFLDDNNNLCAELIRGITSTDETFKSYQGKNIAIPSSITIVRETENKITGVDATLAWKTTARNLVKENLEVGGTLEIPVTVIGSSTLSILDPKTIVFPDSITSFDGYLTNNGTETVSVENLESVILPYGVTELNSAAFRNCPALTNVSLPNSLISIGERAFENCTALENIIFSNALKYIHSDAFDNCCSLTSVSLPNTVLFIGDKAFQNCTALENITLSNNLESIGAYAFRYCNSLTNIVIPNTVLSIGDDAFYSCSNLLSASVPSTCIIGTNTFPSTCTVTYR